MIFLIGHSLALFMSDQLAEPATPLFNRWVSPPIDADAFKIVVNWGSNPPIATAVKVGHNRYEFVRPQLRLEKVMSVCVDEVKAFDEAVAT